MTFRERIGFGAGGGGGFIVPDSAIIPFADNAARDTWAAANLSDLIRNQTVVEVTGTPNNTWYLWRGETNPAAYDNTLWVDATPILRGPQGVQGPQGMQGDQGPAGADGIQGIFTRNDGQQLPVLATIYDFTGPGVTASGNGVLKTINVPGGIDGITVREEGSALPNTGTQLNFTGAGVTASGSGDVKTINIPGGGGTPGQEGIQGITIQDEGGTLFNLTTTLNFTGAGVTASGSTEVKTINIPGGAFNGFTVEDEGNSLSTTAQILNFVGDGVTASGTGNEITITIGATPTGAEDFYYGISDSNNPGTVDLATLSTQSVGTGSGQQFTFSIGPTTMINQVMILLVPADHDITSLVNTDSGFSVLNSFTRTANVRTINTNQYNSYVLQNLVNGFEANYRATLA